jgi:hypothetical protein
MDVVFAISGHRKVSEEEVLNSYTFRQASALCEHIMRDRFLVVSEVLKSFGGGAKKPSSSPPKDTRRKAPGRPNTLPSFYKVRPGARVSIVDLDGPMEALQPFLGKKALNRAVFTERANAR